MAAGGDIWFRPGVMVLIMLESIKYSNVFQFPGANLTVKLSMAADFPAV